MHSKTERQAARPRARGCLGSLVLLPAYFKGEWSTDTLTLKSTFIFWDGHAAVASGDDPDSMTPPTIVLKKSDEAAFQAACARLGGAAAGG